MRKIITKTAIFLTISTICFAGENIESDIEKGIASIKIASSITRPSIAADEKQEEQTFQGLPMAINDVVQANNRSSFFQKWDYILVPTGKFISEYGIQTASGLTVLGIWYRYFS